MKMTCGKCGAESMVVMTAEFLDRYQMSVVLTPHPGSLIEARVLAKTLDALHKALASVAKDAGAKVVVFVDRIETKDDGALHIDVLVCRTKAHP